ncbi:HTH-type transcriptional repressor Bm3R1 [Zhongshania aliphaticivorans]|uniref:HTH-type transcriptional repressor Bm3R1 n=1 Tax=Zhongshania aliphaticivorans TaxID=1470434 RepID=A0A5S9NH08_9GAMM|nr:TetR/AcrR family transcriptional regulator [Zhongshania aliphaticivorans]CAA0089658.1 HTH-type transcriptional repressor Bm3R1 [Zhongshania aliphaticivorans]CAA0096571.1 HTH-type transcriptional repressor Bm3R1 [Zhongshania aliphaticivorans]
MAYRETSLVKQRKATQKSALLYAAETLVREGGFGALTIQALAKSAGVGVGTVYRYFSNKDELSTEVFRRATAREVESVKLTLAIDESVPNRVVAASQVFAQRAFAAPKLAWALIAEPVDPAVDLARLEYRKTYSALFEAVIQEGVDSGVLVAQNPALSASALVGAMAESLLGPLGHAACNELTTKALGEFCLRAIGVVEFSENK